MFRKLVSSLALAFALAVAISLSTLSVRAGDPSAPGIRATGDPSAPGATAPAEEVVTVESWFAYLLLKLLYPFS